MTMASNVSSRPYFFAGFDKTAPSGFYSPWGE